MSRTANSNESNETINEESVNKGNCKMNSSIDYVQLFTLAITVDQ